MMRDRNPRFEGFRIVATDSDPKTHTAPLSSTGDSANAASAPPGRHGPLSTIASKERGMIWQWENGRACCRMYNFLLAPQKRGTSPVRERASRGEVGRLDESLSAPKQGDDTFVLAEQSECNADHVMFIQFFNTPCSFCQARGSERRIQA
eukprot:TRINITY_DN2359_c0_g1_i1.p1 TRINITY_DN2359_c0_g1~~TRINITY_DN2359_c0_g1_i1.p1  ORF type:complete len:150 (+),score=7.37 TRINITY_DN2359_c0_g1_i1:88-537(+)